MRILYHHRTLGDGAEGVHITQMIRAFERAGHEVQTVCPSSAAAGRGRDGVAKNTSLVAKLKAAAPRAAFRAAEVAYNAASFQQVRRAIRDFRPDFVYERHACFNFGGIRAAKEASVPVVLEVNTPYSEAWSKYDTVCFPRLARRIENYCWSTADRVAAVSGALANHIASRGVDRERLLVTHNGVDPANFSDVTANRSEMVTVGFVGSLRVWHGIPMFIEVMKRVLREHLNCQLLIVGDGDLRPICDAMAADAAFHGRIVLTGAVPHGEVRNQLLRMDVAVMPDTNFYGSPLKIFEYMATRLVTVAPDAPPIQEIIEDGVNGLLFRQGDAESMYAALKRAVSDKGLRDRLGAAGRESVLRQFTWDRNVEVVIEAVGDLTNKVSVLDGAVG